MTRVTSDVETLNELFSSGVVTVFGDVFTLVAIMAMMLVDRLAARAGGVRGDPARAGSPRRSSAAGCATRSATSGSGWRGSTPSCRSTCPGCGWCSSSGGSGAAPSEFAGVNREPPRGAPPLDHDLRGLLSGRRGAHRGGAGAAALVRRAPDARRDADGRGAGGVHPAAPAASSSRCRTSPRSSTSCRARWRRRSGSSACSTSR